MCHLPCVVEIEQRVIDRLDVARPDVDPLKFNETFVTTHLALEAALAVARNLLPTTLRTFKKSEPSCQWPSYHMGMV
jgi:hypothetical protein